MAAYQLKNLHGFYYHSILICPDKSKPCPFVVKYGFFMINFS